MSNNIDSITQQYLQLAGHLGESQAKGKSGDTAGGVAQSKATSSANPETDTIELTDAAQLLRSLSDQIAQVSEVDQPRVEAVRERIEAGQYEISSDRIAYKMMAMDQSIPTEN